MYSPTLPASVNEDMMTSVDGRGKVEMMDFLLDKPLLQTVTTNDDRPLSPTPPPTSDVILDWRRWLVLFAFCVLAMNSAQQWIVYSPVVEQAKEYFDMNSFQIDSMSLVYLAGYPVFAPFTCISFQRLGLKVTLCIGAGAGLLAALLRLVVLYAYPNYVLLVLIHCVSAFAQFSTLSTPIVLAEEWFPAKQRTFANVICCNAVNVGVATGLLLPPLVVTPENHSTSDFGVLFGGYLLPISSVAFVACLAIPKQPVSLLSPTKKLATKNSFEEQQPTSLKEVVSMSKEALSNRSFLLLNVAVGVGVGSFWAFSTVSTQMFLPYGISEKMTGSMGFSNIAVGSLFAIVGSRAVDRTKRVKESLFAALGLVLLCQTLITVVLATSRTAVLQAEASAGLVAGVFALYTVLGIGTASAGAIGLELAAEITFPVPPSVTGGIVMFSASAISLGLTLGPAAFLGEHPSQDDAISAMCIFIGATALATLSVLPVDATLHRHAHEQTVDGQQEQGVSACEERALEN